jgi:N-acetylglucosaminyldiphosphoundecaprenol N-acetyl-beta-D-mannosaminyltransferase
MGISERLHSLLSEWPKIWRCLLAEEILSLNCGAIKLHSLSLETLFCVTRSGFRQVVPVNAEVFTYAHTDQKLNQIMRETINTIDGRVLQGICKLLYPKHKILRQNGSNFIMDLAQWCVMRSERLFLLGATARSNDLAVERLRSRFPGLQIAGFSPAFQDYPFDRDWNADILKAIEEFRPQHLGVCFGPKKQEYWIHENASRLSELGVRCGYALGGTIDFLAGVQKRAPRWIEFIGAEWLFRLACMPRARFRRTLIMFQMPVYAARTVRGISPWEA